ETNLWEGGAGKFKRRPRGVEPVQDQAPPSRSAVVSVRASFGRQRQSRVLGSGVNGGGRHCGVWSEAAAGRDSYRFAALSHEFRNLRKSVRVSLSAACSARAAHSAAFFRQYPIFSCIAALDLSSLCAASRRPMPNKLNSRESC